MFNPGAHLKINLIHLKQCADENISHQNRPPSENFRSDLTNVIYINLFVNIHIISLASRMYQQIRF